MGKSKAKVLDIDGEFRESLDFPVAVVREPYESENGLTGSGTVVDPIFNENVTRNLYGRILTIVEATCEANKLKAVKDLFSKEITAWENDVYRSARQIADKSTDPNNIYIR